MTWLLYKVRTYFWDLLRNKDLNNIYFTREWIQWEDNRFFNFIFKKTSSDFIYFDRQEKDGLYFSSKLQA